MAGEELPQGGEQRSSWSQTCAPLDGGHDAICFISVRGQSGCRSFINGPERPSHPSIWDNDGFVRDAGCLGGECD